MKRLLLVLLVVFAFDAGARDIDKTFTGSWYNAAQSGHGFAVEVLPDGRAVIYWYVYNPDGTPTFLLAVGNITGNTVQADVYHQTGMPFGTFDNSNLVQTLWGTLTFTVNSCTSATLSYSSTMSIDGEPFGSGTIQLTRLASVAGLKCTASPMQGNMHATVIQPNGEVAFGGAMLFANGDMVFFGADSFGAAVAIGTWQESGTGRFSFTATVYDYEGGTQNISGNGTYFEDGIEASYSGGGQLIASRLPSFNRDLSYGDLAGTYDIIDPLLGDIGDLTIAADGSLSGSSIDGCSVAGALVIPDRQFNQAYFQAEVSDCTDAVTLTGAATYDFEADDIVVAGSDGFYAAILLLE
jgi:hypothetical protein